MPRTPQPPVTPDLPAIAPWLLSEALEPHFDNSTGNPTLEPWVMPPIPRTAGALLPGSPASFLTLAPVYGPLRLTSAMTLEADEEPIGWYAWLGTFEPGNIIAAHVLHKRRRKTPRLLKGACEGVLTLAPMFLVIALGG